MSIESIGQPRQIPVEQWLDDDLEAECSTENTAEKVMLATLGVFLSVVAVAFVATAIATPFFWLALPAIPCALGAIYSMNYGFGALPLGTVFYRQPDAFSPSFLLPSFFLSHSSMPYRPYHPDYPTTTSWDIGFGTSRPPVSVGVVPGTARLPAGSRTQVYPTGGLMGHNVRQYAGLRY